MTQILNILRKDVRHLRLEILATLGVLVLFILIQPKTWMSGVGPSSSTAQVISFLVIVSWGVLILRLVQDERLTGLNQFWTTRPYEWPKLLAAKAFFVALFLYIPFLLTQAYLLHHAGFSITASLHLLFHNLLLVTCVIVLPLVCVAIVTASFSQAVLTILGIAVAFLGLQAAFGYLGSISATFGLPRRAPLITLPLELAIGLLFFAAAILLQYSRRVTRKSIAVLAAAAALVILIPQLLEGSSAAASGFAAVSDLPASVTIDTSEHQNFSAFSPKNPRTATYGIPLRFSDYAPGSNLNPEAQRYTLTAADGYTWTSDWLEYHTPFAALAPAGSETAAHTRAFIDIPWRVVPNVTGRPVSIRIEFLFDQLASETPYTYSLPDGPHAVPGLGVCALDDGEENLYCRAPFGAFGFSTVTALGSPNPCEASPDEAPSSSPPVPEKGFLTGPWRQPGSPLPAIAPVLVNQLYLVGPHNQRPGHPCPGTPITFTVRHTQRRIYLATPPATLTLNTPPPAGRLGP